jgi:hypothetical protein
MYRKMTRLAVLFFSSTLLFSCQKDLTISEQAETGAAAKDKSGKQELKFNTFYGPQVSMGDGKARSFVTISHAGVPSELGIEMTDDALKGLPGGEEEVTYVLPLHKKAQEVTPFDHISMGWNPHGHPPPHVYDVPHFDFHFYRVSLEEQLAVVEGPLMEKLPASSYLPDNYFPLPGGVPEMGKHWLDATSPELNPNNPQPFTKTLIYGTYNGEVTFLEPMVTLAVLQSGQTLTSPIPQPQLFSPANTYYPESYSVSMDKQTKKHYIILADFDLK